MSPKGKLNPGTKTRISLKRSLIFGAGAIIIGAVVWKIFFATVATIASTTDTKAMFTPSNGPVITGHTWEATLVVDYTKVMDTCDISDFPLLIQRTIPALKSTANGGNVESPDGFDILFAGENDQQLDHQLEAYDPTTGAITAWVRLPILFKNVNTELKIMCGNPNAVNSATDSVWDNSYEAVWHMNNDPSFSDLIDYANNFDAQPHTSMNSSNLVSGKIGSAIEFDGNTDFFAIKNKSYQTQGEIHAFTISTWVKTSFNHSSWTSNWAILDFDRSEKFHLSVHGQGYASFCTRNAQGGMDDMFSGNAGQLNNGEWQQVVVTFDNGEKKVYINGVLVDTEIQQSNAIGTAITRYGFIGDGSESNTFNGSRNNRHYEGLIDELRLSNKALSVGRIQTEYNNQSFPETFVQLGATSNLPIELGDFNAELEDDHVLITWDVLSQLNNDYFIIERATDAADFEFLGKVDGAGTTQSAKSYELIDDNPEIGINYYRLTQTDVDGKTETFNPVAVEYVPELESITIEKAYPNPFSDQFTVDFTVSESTYVQFAVLNSSGMQIAGDKQFVQAGTNTYKFKSMDPLPSGVYFFHITQDGKERETIQLIKR